ncbi:MAG: RNA-binding S4 domain-containing protein [Candidatus Zixiibacteriota bacterium]|nr:MAG: RNA-binding S4 domain-containing protein [candidate division Zixibacteria bacterium]
MRLDQFLSKVGIIKRRTVAKEMADSGLIKINGRRGKPAAEIKTGDIISVGGNRQITIEVNNLPSGNVKKEERESYFKRLD